jgi:hypothetical protein
MDKTNLSYGLGAAYLVYQLSVTASVAFIDRSVCPMNVQPGYVVGATSPIVNLTPGAHVVRVSQGTQAADLFWVTLLQIILVGIYLMTGKGIWLILFMAMSAFYVILAFTLLGKKDEDMNPQVLKRKNWLWGTVITSILCIALPLWYNYNVKEVFGSGQLFGTGLDNQIATLKAKLPTIPTAQRRALAGCLLNAAERYKNASSLMTKSGGKYKLPKLGNKVFGRCVRNTKGLVRAIPGTFLDQIISLFASLDMQMINAKVAAKANAQQAVQQLGALIAKGLTPLIGGLMN